jgi:hypothetical protein
MEAAAMVKSGSVWGQFAWERLLFIGGSIYSYLKLTIDCDLRDRIR